ncbi:apolipoprotein N-acyltransferase [Actinoplanes sp. N902-109]|uniref:apolipoprotein N-acyltransferase n=1 Tax=Actinoplanes sp. (strain N902-109) TaxID=649831 RepID=UPI00032958C7|nr:apolipoprotein N-acyltransferase [Actinoplanes sp. N902-109]AGL17441.1 apolipoprotein n-acyltransferase [Actinoplanes sp. N902-109]
MTLQPTPAGTPRPAGPAAPRPLPLWASVLLAVAAGAGLLLALPPYGLWWLAPLGVGLLAVAAHRRRLRGGLGTGFLAGLVLFVPLLDWTRIAAGWLPWLLLSVAQAGYLGLLGLACAWLSPLTDRVRWLWPLSSGLLWVLQESLRDRAPFGGFPWGRLAFSQGEAPALRLAVWGGAPLVTFAVGAAGGAVAALLWRSWRRGPRRTVLGLPVLGLPVLGPAVVLAVLVAGPLLVPTATTSGPSTRVAIVQGNVPRLGLDFNAQRAAVLDNHVRATEDLARKVAAGSLPRPDLVIWPENSSDIDPLRNPDAAQAIAGAADAVGVPILVGTVLRTDVPGEIYNAALLWRPVTGPDLEQTYTKRHPVPFAEYMPLRSIARKVTDKADLVQNMLSGKRPGVIRTPVATIGDVICFEVAYDGIVRDTVTGGAQILTVQTNNATFNEAEARQQLAMVQLRAVEHGRDALMVSTVGVSAFARTDGRVEGATGFDVDAVVLRDMHLDGPRTLATRLGLRPEMIMAGLAVLVLLAALPLRRRTRRDVTAPETD